MTHTLGLRVLGAVALMLFASPVSGAKPSNMTGSVSIAEDGVVTVDLVHNEKPVKYTTGLTDAERAWFRTVVRAVPEDVERDSRDAAKKGLEGGGVPRVSMRVVVDGKERNFGASDDPVLEPLWDGASRLITQAIILSDLENKAYDALTSLSPLHAGPKVFQPAAMVEGLTRFVRTCQDDGKLGYALNALAWATTPEQFAGTIAAELERGDDERREFLLDVTARHPFVGNIPKPHLRALETLHTAAGKPMKKRAA